MTTRILVLALLAAVAVSPSTSAQRILHQFPASYLTFEMGAAGDVDADGHADFFFGSSNTVSLYSGAAGAHIRTYTMAPTDHAGAVSDVGDINQDGASDLGIVVDCYNPTLGIHATIVRIHDGATGVLLHQFTGEAGTVFFVATHVRGLGDVDADGVPDIGMMLRTGAETGFGCTVQVRSGATGALLWTTPTSFSAGYSDCGDVDGDGHDDFMVSVDLPSTDLRVISGATGNVIRTHPTAGMVHGLAGGMDVDGDGVDDYAYGRGVQYTSSNVTTVTSGATGAVIRSLPLGFEVSMGDYNGDGRGDVIAGMQNSATIWSGVSGRAYRDLTSTVMAPLRSRFVGDVDGDGLEDVMYRGQIGGSYNVIVIAGERAMGANGDSMLQDAAGNEYDILEINGTAGGQQRCVGVEVGDPIVFDIRKPAYDPAPMCHVVVFGGFGVPMEDEAHALNGVQGDMAFLPRPSAPNHALLFTLFSSFGNLPGGVLMHTPPAPFTVPVPQGIGFPIEMTFQGVMIESDLDVKRTNGIILRVH